MAWVVNDLQKTVDRWVTEQGVGPFYVMRRVPMSNVRYRGKPATGNFDVAVAQSGGVQIEFIQQLDDAPSVYRDSYAPGEEGFHHICHIVDDVGQAVQHFSELGHEVGLDGSSGAIKFAYVDTRAGIGCMTELVQRHPDTEAFSKMIIDAAYDWDGQDPVREI
jgi:catechol 2,3-dioxygenase-like lactoylglutathione lyase family enzyme